jgi:hypothetical protein
MDYRKTPLAAIVSVLVIVTDCQRTIGCYHWHEVSGSMTLQPQRCQ